MRSKVPAFSTASAVALCAALSAPAVDADTIFTRIEQGFRGLDFGSVEWGDYDGDGYVDLLATGIYVRADEVRCSYLYKNNGDMTFTIVPDSFPDVAALGGIDWGDCDGDGDLDILVNGEERRFGPCIAGVHRNDGDNAFPRIGALLEGADGKAMWADWDNDGDLDILIAGLPKNRFYRNDLAEIGGFTEVPSDIIERLYGDAAFADYDRDGDLDLLIVGSMSKGTRAAGNTIIYRNENGSFEEFARLTPQVSRQAACAWVDTDEDGDLDAIVIGSNRSGGTSVCVFRNDQTEFVGLGACGLSGAYQGNIACGDYDNDGHTDVFICGFAGLDGDVGLLYRNDQHGTFVLVDSAGLLDLYNGWAAWGDVDNDSRLDVAQLGFRNGDGRYTRVLRNSGEFPENAPPSAPSGLSARAAGDSVVFTWRRALDDRTPTPCLTYSLRVGTTPGGMDIASPMSQPDGTRLVPKYGTMGPDTMWILKGLRRGSYYWSVQSVDAGYLGSPFATEQTFSIDVLARVKGVVATPGVLSVTLSWLPVMEADARTIRIYRATSAAFADARQVGSVTSDTTAWTDTAVAGGQSYWYWLQAFDGSGAGGGRSVPVRAKPLRPGPRLIAPADSAISTSVDVALLWAALSGTVAYQVQVTRDSATGASVVDTAVSDSTLLLSELRQGTTCFWRVRALLATDTTAWTDAWRFTTVHQTPIVPTLVSPANNSTDVTVPVTFVWTASEHATMYRLIASDGSTFADTLLDTTVSDTTCVASGLPEYSTAYWRVQALNVDSASGWSAMWWFTSGETAIHQARIGKPLPDRLCIDALRGNGTSILLGVPKPGDLDVAIYDGRGTLVRRIVRGAVRAGWQEVRLDGEPMAAGTYCLVVRSRGERLVKRIALMR